MSINQKNKIDILILSLLIEGMKPMENEIEFLKEYKKIFSLYGFSLEHLEKSIYNLNRLKNFFNLAEKMYIPPLKEQIDVDEYSKKLLLKADNFFITYKKSDISLLSIYVNDYISGVAYISSICVLDNYSGRSIAHLLLNLSLDFSKIKEMKRIRLEVNKNNHKALSLYRKNKFDIVENTNNNSYIMERVL